MEVTDVKSSLFSVSLAKVGDIVEGIAHINQCINILLKTRLGSDPLRPEFGCSIFQRFDKPINEVRSLLVNDVKKAIDLFIPEITVVKITSDATLGELVVNIQWAFKNTVNTNQVNITYGIS
jgi:phage baseplate assembly protein W